MSFDKETRNLVARAMAAQGLTGARLLAFSASLFMGRVVKSSDLDEMELGCDPGLSKLLKVAIKAERTVLPKVLKTQDLSAAIRFFSTLQRDFATKGFSTEAALVSEWWAQTFEVFQMDKKRMFEYMRQYFEQHSGLGLPVSLDDKIVLRLIGGAGGAGQSDLSEIRDEMKKQAKKLEGLETAKSEIAKLKSELAKAKKGKDPEDLEKPPTRTFNGKCNICGEKGHTAKFCPNKATLIDLADEE